MDRLHVQIIDFRSHIRCSSLQEQADLIWCWLNRVGQFIKYLRELVTVVSWEIILRDFFLILQIINIFVITLQKFKVK